ncbi:uncharacterized protein LOC116925596 [Daphnia magna]|uniref:uncharacterized protein LOC116925596 n=1 Tax=Daphnia magna TaxID=35525 RepID=UPI001E1BD8CF|nr:uncharacterized protein LOC116925596 [Daphnia magna]
MKGNEHNCSQVWVQQDVEEELGKSLRIVCDKIRVLEERKLNLQSTVLLPSGILAKWLFKKFNIQGNNHMGDSIRSVWQGITEEARLQIYSESVGHKVKVQQQQSVIEAELEKLRLKLKCFTAKIKPEGKNLSVCNFFQGEDLEDRILDYACQECGKIYQTRDSFSKHKNKKHPWQLQHQLVPVEPVPLVPVEHVPLVPVEPVPLEPVEPVPLEPVQPVPLEPVQPVPLAPVQPVPVPDDPVPFVSPTTSKNGSVSFTSGKLRLGLYKRPVPKDNCNTKSAATTAKVCRQLPLQPNSEIHLRVSQATLIIVPIWPTAKKQV